MDAYIALFLGILRWVSVFVLLRCLTDKVPYVFFHPEKVRNIALCFICMVPVCPGMLIT